MKMEQRKLNKWMLFILLALSAFPTFGNEEQKRKTYQVLLEVNSNWSKLEEAIEYTYTPNTETELVQLHLLNVVAYLKTQTVGQFTTQQIKNREKYIAVLSEYAKKGEFPHNIYTSYRTPIFIDADNVHCAVGFLMKESGYEQMAQDIAASQLLAYLGEIEHPQLLAWQKESGLTLFELALIQPTYGPPIPVCASPSPVKWKDVLSENERIIKLFEGHRNSGFYALAQSDDYGLNHEILQFTPETHKWKRIGTPIYGQITGFNFIKNELFITAFLVNEEYPLQILKLKGKKWEKVAHFNGNIQNVEVFENKLYVLGNFNAVNGKMTSNFVVIDDENVQSFQGVGLVNTAFDQIKASEKALFLTSYGSVFKFQNDTIHRLSHIQYYNYFTSMTLDAHEDTLYVSSPSISGYNKYFQAQGHSVYMINMMQGRNYPYHAINFTKSKMVKGRMLIAGDFRASTLIPQVNDERYLVDCDNPNSHHWYGEGLVIQFGQNFYPILNDGIVLDFVELNNQLYILKKDGSISFADLNQIEDEILKLKKRVEGVE